MLSTRGESFRAGVKRGPAAQSPRLARLRFSEPQECRRARWDAAVTAQQVAAGLDDRARLRHAGGEPHADPG